jgi:general secretion pathway protein F
VGTFQYIARTAAGQTVNGAIQAESEAAVVRALDEKRLFPVRVTEQAAGAARSTSGRVKPRDVGILYGQLADLLRADVPVLRALEILSRSTANRRLAAIVGKVRDDVSGGRPLAESMAVHGHVFTPLHVAMVKAGERAGFLEEVLGNLADLVERQDELQSKIFGAMAYPILLAGIGGVIITLLLALLVPNFRPLFEGLPSIPAPTRILFAMSDVVRSAWWLVLPALFLGAGGGWAFLASPYGKRAWDRWRLRIPFMGRALRLLAITRFCRVLGMMIKNGVPLLQALAISKDATGSITLAEGIEAAAENVRAGETLAEPLKACGFFPIEILEMIAVAEESNQLEKTLLGIADTVERRTNRQVDLVVRMIEPAILVVMATGIGFLAVSLVYPIVTMGNVMRK